MSEGWYLKPPAGLYWLAIRKSIGVFPMEVRKSPVCGLMPQALRPETAQPLELVLMPYMALKAPEALTSLLLRNALAWTMSGSVLGTPEEQSAAIEAPVMSMSPGLASSVALPSALA